MCIFLDIPKRWHDFPVARITGSCDPSEMGAGNRAYILCKIIECS